MNHLDDPRQTNEVWKTVEGWCPLCWWRSGKEQFAIATPAAGLRKRLTEKHRLEKPNCHEKIRVEGK